MKSILVVLDVDIPDTELSKPVTVDIEGRTYTGTCQAIVTHEVLGALSTVTLEAQSLKVKTA